VANADFEPSEKIRKISMKLTRAEMESWPAPSYLNVAIIKEKNKDLVAAEESCKKAVSLVSESTSALMALGAFYEASKRGLTAGKQFQLRYIGPAES